MAMRSKYESYILPCCPLTKKLPQLMKRVLEQRKELKVTRIGRNDKNKIIQNFYFVTFI